MTKGILKKVCVFAGAMMLLMPATGIQAAEDSGIKGKESDTTEKAEIEFDKVEYPAVVVKRAGLKMEASDDAESLKFLSKGEKVTVTGLTKYYGYCRVKTQDGDTYYMNRNNLKIEKQSQEAAPAADEQAVSYTVPAENAQVVQTLPVSEQAAVQTSAPAGASNQTTYTQNSGSLNAAAGVHYGPSGKETYYNLNMDGVISGMRDLGNNDAYWVRDDGVKMLGNYVMAAADYSTYPKGSIVESSLGQAIVVDTGGFAYGGSTQLDIATAW